MSSELFKKSCYRKKRIGFTLIEVLVTISVIGVLMSIILPALAGVRRQANKVVCMSNLRQLGFAFVCYATDNDGYVVGGCDTSTNTYWWGQKQEDGIYHERGPLSSYMKAEHEEGGVFECPSQDFGTYGLQGKPPQEPDDEKWITSTYGYNGYYLSPPASGWPQTRMRPWRKLSSIKRPDKVIVFADSLMDWDTGDGVNLTNISLLDPPMILSGNGKRWVENSTPTTCFRHEDRVNILFGDLHCDSRGMERGVKYVCEQAKIGSITKENDPYYVPDWQIWVDKPVARRR